MAPQKRKASSSAEASSSKRSNTSRSSGANGSGNGNGNTNDINSPHPGAQQAEEFGIVLREFYPPEMNNARCEAYSNGTLERPIDTLNRAYADTEQARRRAASKKNAVVHWFKSDLRLKDNRSLKMAYDLAQSNKTPLICLYILSPQDLTAHLASPARVDFTLRNLTVLKKQLDKLDIPLYMETQDKRRNVPNRIVELCEQWGVSHLFANIEYEVDELRREAKLVQLLTDKGIAFETAHDSCVVTPGALQSQQGRQYAVYSPWYRSWMNYLHQHDQNLTVLDAPGKNNGRARSQFADLFDSEVPDAPQNKQLKEEDKQRFRDMYPEGEEEAMKRLDKFIKTKATEYNKMRSMVDGQYTSILSPYLAAGVLSARTAVSMAKDANGGYLDGKNAGLACWISEVAWRDFYKHVLVHWPFICMNKCFKPEFTNVEWEYDEETFTRWTQGKTGVPIVDAAMRQIQHDGWMHNRNRMIVSSFLSKDLLIDWRRGERYFMENLIDSDFASNHGGWGFGSSTGVDPQPYFRIFNPLLQSEKFDPSGEFIRKWVPELRGIKDRKAIHDPYNRGAAAVAQKAGYPRAIVEHAASRERALQKYKEGIARGKA